MVDQITEMYEVCSAHAEMIPRAKEPTMFDERLLRTRGDDPPLCMTVWDKWQSAPHTRR